MNSSLLSDVLYQKIWSFSSVKEEIVMKIFSTHHSHVHFPYRTVWFTVFLVFLLHISEGTSSASPYMIGLGSYDITGPAADVNMMGYANLGQIASGVHFRLRARTFIVAEPKGNRVVFVNLDACMASQIVTIKVLERLKARYGDLYTEQNVAISGIHTHAGPGGYLQYVVYIVTSLGFVRQSFDVIVDGIEKSIIQAHENLQPGSIFVNKGELLNAGVSRSPSAYLNNPASERSKYKYDVDKEMTLIKFVDNFWGPVGSFNWFATHGTSMSRTNSLISGDNKGAAARFMEDWFEQKRSNGLNFTKSGSNSIPRRVSSLFLDPKGNRNELIKLAASFQSSRGQPATRLLSTEKRVRNTLRKPGRPQFVSAFCQSNCGDVSPNVLGAFCLDTSLPCDFDHSTCNGKNELCYGRGPGYPDEFESTRIIGERQFEKAVELFDKATQKLKGKIRYRQAYVDFSTLKLSVLQEGGVNRVVETCPAALGFAFAAGTTDGPGAFDFKQGDDQGNAFWRLVRNALKTPTQEQIKCQHPKPVVLDTGEMKEPYDWAPSIVPVQILQIGQLVILSVPAEFTTMAGRRLREAVRTVLISEGNGEFDNNVHIVIAGLTNTYSQYVTTFEEYQVQRYEGASTLFGPHTLEAYIEEFKKLAAALIGGQAIQPGPQPPDLLEKQISLLTPVVVDSTPSGVNFGDVKTDVPQNSTFKRGDMISVTFWSACPRNDLMTEGTFALVELLQDHKTWIPAYDDDDFCLRFKWLRLKKLSPQSYATIEWRIPESAAPGVYRITHFGASKALLGSIRHFTGSSSAFLVA
ncbi:Neutral/alkaline nonlysosomal ceramidase [Parasponia andersonii]|uniref:Neutral ceramidase n=1 Tax=Parasponia andersonii TaxID=3476 RepID=A0A2P5AK63_PARAD|nr:Neutral/alkaline nonlysosomal ceramidase [Parasponia andersonii]